MSDRIRLTLSANPDASVRALDGVLPPLLRPATAPLFLLCALLRPAAALIGPRLGFPQVSVATSPRTDRTAVACLHRAPNAVPSPHWAVGLQWAQLARTPLRLADSRAAAVSGTPQKDRTGSTRGL